MNSADKKESFEQLKINNPNDLSQELAFNSYKQQMFRIMSYIFPQLNQFELNRAIDWSINKRVKNSDIYINDNYREINTNTSTIAMVNYLLSRRPILTSFGCLFSQHGDVPNPLYQLIQEFADRRDTYKKEMFKYDKGSELYNRYNLLQLVSKVDTNAIYGCLGAPSSIFYNIYVASSITRQGRSSISASLMLFESLLANNAKFGSFDEIMVFIDNVITETPIRKYNDNEVLNSNIPVELVFNKLILTCGYNCYMPSLEEANLLWDILNKIKQSDLNRIYYKNNMFEFFENEVPLTILKDILGSLESPFLDPNSAPKEIELKLDTLTDLVKEYVYYQYQVIDKIERVERLIREVVVVVDTDSCMINLNPWYKFIEDKVKYCNFKIKNYEIDALNIVDNNDINHITDMKETDTEFVYDFQNEQIIEQKRLINPIIIIPEDGLRHSIINIMVYMITKILRVYFDRISMLNNTINDEHPKSLMIMKNEFLFKHILLTLVKKHYASHIEVQEGHVIPNNMDAKLDVKGLEIDKTTLPESTRNQLKKILYEDILNVDNVNQLKILSDIAILERKIIDSIMNGNIDYYKPVRIKSIDNYKAPERIQGVKGAIIYNELKDESEPMINLNQQNSLLIIKTKINLNILEDSKLKTINIDKFNKFKELLINDKFKLFTDTKSNINSREINSIAIPDNISVPKWIFEFIDYNTIIKDNISSFPIESVGFTKLNTKSAYSGILQL